MSLDFDPIAVEIHRKALENITNEMALTLVRTSGSPVVVDAKDFSTCLLDTIPEQLGFSAYILLHTASSLIGARTIAGRIAGSDLRPGDGWVANDPYDSGAMHQGDVGIIMPLFHHGDHVGWAFSNVHVLDIGGGAISGFAPNARTMYEEALRFPAVRIIQQGEIEPEWERFIAANVRTPGPVLNDIRSMIAANNVAENKLSSVIDRFGIERHRQYCEITKDLTEQAFRRRIERLPDGVYETVEVLQCDPPGAPAEMLEVHAKLEISGSEMAFGFTGPPQVEALINSTLSPIMGAAMGSILTMLGYGDLPFNAGIWRPLSFDNGPEGTILNPLPPAPVSMAHAAACRSITRPVHELISQAAALSDDAEIRARVAGQCHNATSLVGLFGKNQRDAQTVLFYIDTHTGMGGPAQTVGDGQDGYGATAMSGCGMSDVETHEATDPVLFLWRRVSANSGGPGQFRGGQGVEQAYAVRYTDSLAGYGIGAMGEPTARGFGGGGSGSCSDLTVISSSNLDDLIAADRQPIHENLTGDTELVVGMKPALTARCGDVLQFTVAGGGGLGDPLLRDPSVVARDISDGYITERHAGAAYGVVLASRGELDVEATELRRADLRRERIGQDPERELYEPVTPGVAVVITGHDTAGRWACGYCGSDLCSSTEDWHRTGVVVRSNDLLGRFAQLDLRARPTPTGPQLVIYEHYCPHCAGALGVDILLPGSERPPAPKLAARQPALAQ
jgi:N-methylhydantoinase B